MLILLLLLFAAPCFSADLFRDDFSKFAPGWLTYPVGRLNGAIQEYHYLPYRGVPLGTWENAISHLDAWLVGEEDGCLSSSSISIAPQNNLPAPYF